MRKYLVILLGVWFVCFAATAASAEKYKDEKLGFEFVHPKKWNRMPLSSEERWMVAKFTSPREYQAPTSEGYYTIFRPYLDVIVIAKAVEDATGATVRKTEDGKIVVQKDAPWKNLKEYLEEHCKSIGGFHFSAEDEDEVNGMKVRRYEVTIDKLVDGERRVYGWEFETEDAYYGLVTHILAKDDKLWKEIESSFKSFKTFPRTGALPNTAKTGEDIVIDDGKEDTEVEISEEDLRKRRDLATSQTLEKIKGQLDKTWSVIESKNFIAVTHTDSGYTKDLLKHAEALRGWMDDTLGFVGSGYVGKVIIRVCADQEEHSAYEASRNWYSESPEVVTYRDREGWTDWAMESLNRGLFKAWMRDRNDNILWGAPSWLRNGLTDVVSGAVSKGSKVQFKADIWDRQGIAVLDRDGKLLSAKSFFTMTSDTLWSDYENHRQAQFFTRFLLVGAGSKGKYKNVLKDYVKNLIFLLDEEDAAQAKASGPKEAPKTEAEEDARFKERQTEWSNKEAQSLESLLQKTFPDWTDKDWDKLDSAYKAEIT